MIFEAERVFDGRDLHKNLKVEIAGSKLRSVSQSTTAQRGLLMPGIIDSHIHLLGMGLALQAPNLAGVCTASEFEARIKGYAHKFPRGWIIGRGWDQNLLGFTPQRDLLDRISPHRPLVLYRVCGHVLAANSKVLEMAGIGPDSPEVAGGTIRRDQSGIPTGVMDEAAMLLLDRVVPLPGEPMIYSALDNAIKYAWSVGVTGVQTDDLDQVGDYMRLRELYLSVTRRSPLRVQLHFRVKNPSDLEEFARLCRELLPQDCPESMVTLGGAKLFLDGSLGARTAALSEPYTDGQNQRGVLIWPDEEVRQLVETAVAQGVTLAIHAIGDAAIEQALSALEHAKAGPGHRLIHCQVTTREQIERMARLGVVAEIQPGFLCTDMRWVQDRLGLKRLQTSYCWQSYREAGITLAGGSDAPVEDMNPWLGVNAAVTRGDGRGNFARGWEKDEGLTLVQTLGIYTANNARLAGWNSGELKAGRSADLVWYPDFDEAKLADTKPALTMVNGERVFAL